VLPAVGDSLDLTGTASWPKLDWLYDVPASSDAAGKVVIHWFCAPKVAACSDDLARIVTLKENGRVYVIAYINGTKSQAQKLDPIRESEGVGRGTVAYGRGATKLMKELGLTGPASIVVNVDGKVQLVATGPSPAELDARDAKVQAAIAAIKDYVSTPEGPTQVKAGDKFQLSISIKLAAWLKYSDKSPMEMVVTVPPDIKCDATTLKGEQLKVADKLLTATVTCSGPRGIYEARGELRFGYDAPGGGGTGIGAESARWKFEIKN
jgi:acylphosphatase